jgi:pentatricopeptide repeat protein
MWRVDISSPRLYTSLINGLVLRKRYDTACLFFAKLIKLSQQNLHIDIPVLGAGINALTRAGKPHEAFQAL